MPSSIGISATLPRQLYGSKYQEFTWASEWVSTVGTDVGSANGQQYRGLRVDGSGRVWAAGGLVTYNGAASAEEYVNSTALTVTPGATGQKVNFIAVAHRASDGAHQVATMIGNTNNYARCYAVTHDTENGYTYIAGRAGEHMYTTSGAFQETFQGDTNPNSLYGPQDCYIARIVTATGVVDKASYFGVASEGDFFRDLIYHNGYLYAGRAKYGAGTPTIATQLLKIEADLSDVVATFDFGNTTSRSDGQPALVAHGDNLWIYFITTTAVTNGVPTSGAFQETFGSGSHARSYIGKFDISGSGLTFVQATYVRTLTGTSPLVGPTHTIDWIPRDGGSIVAHLEEADSTCDLPTYGTPQFKSAAGAGGNGYFLQISDTLEGTPYYGTYLHTDTSGERVAGSSIRASRDGKRVLLPMQVDSTSWSTTDGSANAGGVRVGLSIIFRIPEDGVGWEAEHIGYYPAISAFYASEFDAAGNAYVAGYLGNSGAPIPLLQRLTPTVYVPPPILTAATVLDDTTDGLTVTNPNTVTLTIPAAAAEGDYIVVTATVRNASNMTMSVGTKVGQVNTIPNYGMALFHYQVTSSDVPGTTTFTVSAASGFNDFSVSMVTVTGAAGIEATAAPAAFAFSGTATAPALTTTTTNLLVVFAVGQATSNTYSSGTYTEIHEATTGTAGLAVYSHVAAVPGVAGPFGVTASGSAAGYGCAIAFTGT